MKYTIRQITDGEDEVILKYRSLTPEVERVFNFLNGEQQKLTGWKCFCMILISFAAVNP